MKQRTQDTLKWLINKELKEEYAYQEDCIWLAGCYDASIIRDLIDAEKELFYNRARGFDKLIQGELIKGDIEKYLGGLKEEMDKYNRFMDRE